MINLDKLLPADNFRRLIHVMGAIVFLGTLSVTIYFFIEEASDILNEGFVTFYFDLLTMILFGGLFALIGIVPYYVGSLASERSGGSFFFFMICLIVFIFDAWMRINVLFFPKSSTDSIAIIFIPFYLSVPIFFAWAFVYIGKALFKKD
jgi:hypothetical protein